MKTFNLFTRRRSWQPHVAKRGWKKHRYKPYFRKTNDKEKRIKAVQTFKDNHDEFRYARKTKRAGALVDRFRKSRFVEKWVWQDEKDFTSDVRLNSQNSRGYGFEHKDNIQENRLFRHTNRQSKKVMISASISWKSAMKLFFCEWKSIPKHVKKTWKKSFFPKSIVLWIKTLGFLFKIVHDHVVLILFKIYWRKKWAKRLLSAQNGPHHSQIVILL